MQKRICILFLFSTLTQLIFVLSQPPCPDPWDWDDAADACFLPEGALCSLTPGKDDPVCHPTSQCLTRNGTNVCLCLWRFTPNARNICRLDIGELCKWSNDLCDEERFLECEIGGKCGCGHGNIYDEADSMCYALPGFTCQPPSLDVRKCINGTTCNVSSEICECPGASKPSLDEPTTCVVPYGGACSRTEDCDKYAYLQCSLQGTCECIGEGSTSYYDLESSTCLAYVEEPCTINLGMSCVRNAHCKNDTVGSWCTCRFPFEPGLDGLCYLPENQPCSMSNDLCNPGKFLVCRLEGKCGCRDGHFLQTSPGNKGMCQVLPGEECRIGRHEPACVLGAQCVEDICQCDDPEARPSLGDPTQCFVPYGHPCQLTGGAACDPFAHLDCIDNVCICNGEGDTSIRDGRSEKCIRLAGEVCEETGMNCIPTANCKHVDGVSFCVCNFPLSIGRDHLCHLQHGQQCSRENDLCEGNKFLVCHNEGRCSCGEYAIYSPSNDTCLLLPQSPCSLGKGKQSCFSGTSCGPVIVDGITEMICRCPGKSGPSQRDPTHCVIPHGEECTRHRHLCDPDEYLECQKGQEGENKDSWRCGCVGDGGNSYLDRGTKTCYLKANELCSIDSNAQLCTPNSHCSHDHGKLRDNRCICEKGLVANREGKCFLPYEARCGFHNYLCDPASFLACGLERQCECQHGHSFDHADGICKIMPGGKCRLFEAFGPQCMNGTTCIGNVCRCNLEGSSPSRDDPTKCFMAHGESCSGDLDCDPFSHLQCDGDSCMCIGEGKGNSYYNRNSSTCLIYAGEGCVPALMGCVKDAVCKAVDGKDICTCRPPFQRGEDGFCYLQHTQQCSAFNDRCDPNRFLHCDQLGHCSCDHDAWFNSDLETCQLYVEADCSPDDGATCSFGSACSLDPLSRSFKCRCDQELVPLSIPSKDDRRKCFVPYGEQCRADCDPYAHLKCNQTIQRCLCDGEGVSSMYDKRVNKCVRLAGEICNEEEEMRCIPTANCNEVDGRSRCICKDPLSIGLDHLCHLQYGDKCSRVGDLCEGNKFLQCSNEGRCACEEGAIYSHANDMCLLLPESPCSIGKGQPLCINGTYCRGPAIVGDVTELICRCPGKSGPSQRNPSICVIPHGEECTHHHHLCDPSEYLECQEGQGGENRDHWQCGCAGDGSNAYLDPETKTCYLKANELCSPVSNAQMCTPNSYCSQDHGKLRDHRCICEKGLVSNRDGKCFLPYESRCALESYLCDPAAFLFCGHEGSCECQRGHSFDHFNKSCKILPGETCREFESFGPQCIDGSTCMGNICLCNLEQSRPSRNEPTKCFVDHGGICKGDDDCDPFSHLHCDGGTCRCLGEGMATSYYNGNTSTCFIFAGERCVPGLIGCVNDAVCKVENGRDICMCNPPFQKGDDGFCYLQHAQYCSAPNDRCDTNRFLHCDQMGHCSCGSDAWFNLELQTCQLFVDADCLPNSGATCSHGSVCSLVPETRSFKCRCDHELIPLSIPSMDDRRKCFVPYGKQCRADCDPYAHLSCNQTLHLCLCDGEDVSAIYDTRVNKCVRLAGAICDEEEGMGCISTANCKKIDGFSMCACVPPLSKGLDNLCHLQHGQSCSRQGDLCEENRFLECGAEQICSCRPDSIYDSDNQTCLLLPDFPCGLGKGQQSCHPGTECAPLMEGTPTNFTCRCPGIGHRSQVDPRLCVLRHGEACSAGYDMCDPFSFLECHGGAGQCVCRGERSISWLDSDAKTCYLKANELCTPGGGLAQKCTPNSQCFQNASVYQCMCNKGFMSNRHGQCFLPHLSPCSLKNDLCDPASFLICDLQNRCTCGHEAVFNETSGTCHLLAKAECTPASLKPVGGQPCVENALCHEKLHRCDCLGELIGNVQRFCHLEYARNCSTTRDMCDPLSHLECSGGDWSRCLCKGEKQGHSWYNKLQKKCFRLANATCQDELMLPACISNSKCDPIDRICSCQAPFKPNMFNFCFLPFEEQCNSKNDLCDPESFLECKKVGDKAGTCQCQREYEAFYDTNSSTCRLIHDRPCLSPIVNPTPYDPRAQLCDRNALCLSIAPGNATHRCKCNPKSVPNKESICYLPYREECSDLTEECDPYGFLTCRQRGRESPADPLLQCQCATNKMHYEAESQRCITHAGEDCQDYPESQKCVINAHCSKEAMCECNASFEPSYDGGCLLKHGESCDSTNNLCHTHINIDCRGGYCLCNDGYIEHNLNPELGGADKIICLPGHNMECRAPVLPTPLDLGCSPDALLKCNVTAGICHCVNPFQQLFIASEKSCRSSVGMPCHNQTSPCVLHADCVGLGGNVGICECNINATTSTFDIRRCELNGALSTVFASVFLLGTLLIIIL